ncbi:hypothetical protein PO909_025175 [Leuciscus waleckii]
MAARLSSMLEFLQLAHQVPWNDETMKTVFWSGLDDLLFLQVPASATTGTLAQYIDYVLWFVLHCWRGC